MAIQFLHSPKNKKFTFAPRYYNEQKEELENRIKKIKREMGVENLEDSDKPYVPNIKGQMRGYFKKNNEQKRKSTIRLIIVLLILFAIAFFLLFI